MLFCMLQSMYMDAKEKKGFSLIARVGSFKHAFRGIGVFVSSTHNAWVELFFSAVVVYLGFYFSISQTEWFVLVITIGILLMAEAFNTAIEVDINLTSPDFHPYAKDTKDIAAGAVLIAVFLTLIICGMIFVPKILACI